MKLRDKISKPLFIAGMPCHKEILEDKISLLTAKKDWDGIIAIIQPRRKKYYDEWLEIQLAAAYTEKNELEESAAIIITLNKYSPDCTLIFREMARYYMKLGLTECVIGALKALLDYDREWIAQDPCGDGPEWADKLIKDCHELIDRLRR